MLKVRKETIIEKIIIKHHEKDKISIETNK